jgi:5-methylthioadenosine/S-adenosylhomocysteine deaminase
MRTKITNAQIITVNVDNLIISSGSIVFEDGIIVEVNNDNANETVCDRVIDAQNKVLLPGLINTHTHTPMTLLRGYADDLGLEDWLNKVLPIERGFTAEDIALGSELAIIEMLKNGITTFSDLYVHIETIAEKVNESGARAVLARSVIEDQGNPTISEQKLAEATDNVRKLQGVANGRITMTMAPHSIYTCSTEYLLKILEISKQLTVPLQIHLAESANEYAYSIEKFGVSPVKYLDSLGYFDHDILIAHAVYVDEEDINMLAAKGVKISHNPTSNLKLGNGIAPIMSYLDKGVIIGLGTDGAASNNSLDIFAEIKLTSLLQKGLNQNSSLLTASDVLRMGTINGAQALFLDKQLGSIEVGKKADFILLDFENPRTKPDYSLIANLVYSASSSQVTDVFIDGQEIVRNREILTLDVEKTLNKVTKLQKKLYN